MTACARAVSEKSRSKVLGIVSAAGSLGTLMIPVTDAIDLGTPFWIAITRVKLDAVIARSRVTGVRKSPKLCRRPMPRLRSNAAPIRIDRVGSRVDPAMALMLEAVRCNSSLNCDLA